MDGLLRAKRPALLGHLGFVVLFDDCGDKGFVCDVCAQLYDGCARLEVDEGFFDTLYTEDDAANSQRQLASYMSQMILPVMMEDADVKDNRARFY